MEFCLKLLSILLQLQLQLQLQLDKYFEIFQVIVNDRNRVTLSRRGVCVVTVYL